MRFISRNVAFAAMGMLLVPQLAVANDVEEQLRVMQERMAQMEDRLQAASDQLEHLDLPGGQPGQHLWSRIRLGRR